MLLWLDKLSVALFRREQAEGDRILKYKITGWKGVQMEYLETIYFLYCRGQNQGHIFKVIGGWVR